MTYQNSFRSLNMTRLKKYYFQIILVLLILSANWFMMDAQRVEEWYATGVYVYLGATLRFLLGWLPFSVGDLLYIAAIIYVIFTLHKSFKRPILKTLDRLFKVGSMVWLLFHFLWGFNYYRTSIPEQFNLAKGEVKKEEVVAFTTYTLNESNRYAAVSQLTVSSSQLTVNSQPPTANRQPSTVNRQPSTVKPSLFGIIGNYMGYGGYFNPFTGEAQINNYMPEFMLPYIAVHEVAHQKGYAKESEANFIGYIDAMDSGDSALLYSANLEMFLFANRALRRFDSTLAKQNMERLSPRIKKDLADYKVFAQKYYGPVDKFVTWFYTGFLNFNNQPEGMMSYNRGMVYAMRYLKQLAVYR